MRKLAGALILLGAGAAHAEVCRWQDADGTVHFTDAARAPASAACQAPPQPAYLEPPPAPRRREISPSPESQRWAEELVREIAEQAEADQFRALVERARRGRH